MRLIPTFVLGMMLLPAGQAFPQVKTVTLPAVKIPYSQSLQAVVVTTADWTSVKGTARLFERKDRNAKWEPIGEEFPVVVGRSGLAWAEENGATDTSTPVKREGDGKAPAGLFPLTAVFGRSPKSEAVELPYTRLAEFTECVDDVNSSHYN